MFRIILQSHVNPTSTCIDLCQYHKLDNDLERENILSLLSFKGVYSFKKAEGHTNLAYLTKYLFKTHLQGCKL